MSGSADMVTTIQAFWFLTSGLYNHGKINYHHLSYQYCGNLLQQPQEANVSFIVLKYKHLHKAENESKWAGEMSDSTSHCQGAVCLSNPPSLIHLSTSSLQFCQVWASKGRVGHSELSRKAVSFLLSLLVGAQSQLVTLGFLPSISCG